MVVVPAFARWLLASDIFIRICEGMVDVFLVIYRFSPRLPFYIAAAMGAVGVTALKPLTRTTKNTEVADFADLRVAPLQLAIPFTRKTHKSFFNGTPVEFYWFVELNVNESS